MLFRSSLSVEIWQQLSAGFYFIRRKINQIDSHILILTTYQLIQNNQTRWNSLFSAISRFLNCKERITKFCSSYHPAASAKQLSKDDLLQEHHWKQLKHLHNHLETFYEATIIVKGKHTGLANHFQTLNWLLLELERTKHRFIELSKQSKKKAEVQGYCYLAACAEAAWQKCEKYYVKADDTAAYYIAIVLNLMLKMQWFHNQ